MGIGIEQMFDWHGNGNRIETYGNGKELERSREAFPHISNCTGCGYRSASPTSSVALPMALYKYVYDYDYDKLYVLVRRSLHGATPRYLSKLVLPVDRLHRLASSHAVDVHHRHCCSSHTTTHCPTTARSPWPAIVPGTPDVGLAQSVNSFKNTYKVIPFPAVLSVTASTSHQLRSRSSLYGVPLTALYKQSYA